MAKLVFVPSKTSLEVSRTMDEQTEVEIAQDYINLPEIPYGKKVKIVKLGAINFDVMTKRNLNMLKFKNFRALKPEDYPAGENPQEDYMDEDQVSPVIIHIQGNSSIVKCKAKMLLWFALTDIVSQIIKRQSIIGRKLLPTEVLIDERDQWICHLMNLGARG